MKKSDTNTVKKQVAAEINVIVFVGSLIFYLVLLIIENLFTSFVTGTFNPHYILVLIVGSGFLNFFLKTDDDSHAEQKKPGAIDYIYIFSLAIIGFIVTWYSTRSVGPQSWLLSSVAGIITLVIGFVLSQPDDDLPRNIDDTI